MLKIVITPTMLTFNDLSDEMSNKLHSEIGLKWNYKGYYYVEGTQENLFKILLKLSYDYDIEIV